MPYPIATGAICEASIIGTEYNQTTLTVLHYKYGNAAPVADGDNYLSNFALDLQAAGELISKYLACCSQDWTYFGLRLQWVYPTRYHRFFSGVGTGPGTIALAGAPPNIAASITRSSDLAGRHGIGTIHVPGQPLDISDNGLVRNTRQAALDSLADKLKKAYMAGDMIPVLFNRTNAPGSFVVTGAKRQDTVRVMRRRTVGLGI